MVLILSNIILVITAVLGMYFIAHKNRYGFIVFFITEACYVVIGVYTAQYGLIITAGVYFSMNVYSWIKWGKR